MDYKFELNPEEILVCEKWVNEQIEKSREQDFMGARFSFQFTPTVIGKIVTVIDNELKQEKTLRGLNVL